MKLKKVTAILFISQLLVSCASMDNGAKFNSSAKGASYKSATNSMKIFVEVTPIGSEGALITKNIGIVQTFNDASQSLVNAFKTKMTEAGVTVLVKSFGSVDVVKNDTSTVKTAKSVGFSTMVAGENASSEPLLAVQIGATEAENTVWNGRVSWNLSLVDPTVWTPKNQTTIWKGTTELMQFGPLDCSQDAYKTCADKFVDSVIAQLRAEKLIK